MRIYKTTAINQAGKQTKWATSLDGAASNRSELTKAGYRRDEVKTEPVEYQSTKAGTIDMLNTHAN